MARSRNIKPAFFENDELAECKPLARLLFIGLWTVADCQGVLEDRPRRIKAQVLPYDECDIEALLSELISHGFIRKFQVDQSNYLHIIRFVKHQNPHKKEEAKHPAPIEPGASPELAPNKNGASRADSFLLNPDSGNLNPDSLFDDFWKVVHRKEAKPKAKEAFKKAVDALAKARGKGEAEAAMHIVKRMKLFANSPQANDDVKGRIHPTTWLNQGRYDDDESLWFEVRSENRNVGRWQMLGAKEYASESFD